jgi:hypothetical protein
MAKNSKPAGLDINEDMSFQHKEWTVERIGWVFLLILILAALAGVLGVGPVSTTSQGGQDAPFWVEYERFGRFKSPTTLTIHPNPQAVENGEFVFWVEDDYLKKFQIEYILPEPDSVEIGQDRYFYHFMVSPPGVADEITFYMQTQTIGTVDGNLGVGESLVYELTHFIYP